MIDERDVGRLLRGAADDIAVGAAPARALAAAGRRRRHRRRTALGAAAAAAVAVVAVAVPTALNAQRSTPTARPANPAPTASGRTCVDPVPSRVLPGWARAGFSEARPRIPFVVGDKGDIAAILFAQPLTAPPPADHNNKILWVSRVGVGSSLRISAALADGSARAVRVVAGGPGPSIVDLPKPGCWHLTLHWGQSSDSLDLAYRAP